VQEDAFHEIQLNGKQLVFMFMVATIASVVIFLSGVFVGRGVRVERSGSDEAAALVEAPVADAAPAKSSTAPALAQGTDPRVVAPPPAVDDQSYVSRLEKRNPPVEDLKPASASSATGPHGAAATGGGKAAPVPPAPSKSAARSAESSTAAKPAEAKPGVKPAVPAAVTPPAAAAPAAAAASAAPAAPASGGFVVQVAALNARNEADAIAKRLVAKGYAAFVQTPSNGTPAVFRVRIGPLSTRLEADALAAKLQKEEQFKPWVTR
jgi:cell division septation protein DedD